MDAVTAGRLAEVWGRNPFEPAPDSGGDAALAEVAARPAHILEELARRGLMKEARRLSVAIAAWECSTRGDSRMFDARAVPEAVFAAMGLPRRSVRAAATAAARCRAAIARIAGESPAIQRLRADTWRACFGESLYGAIGLRPVIREQNVLILGETGTGKELVAEAIAAVDPDPERLQLVNAAAIPRELLEAELFGHARGAFTGAVAERDGKIVGAEGGTLFLDEIADLPSDLQAKLLRVIEDDRVTPLGSNKARRVDVRYVAATSQPLPALVEGGRFRRDLYERLAGVTISIPPLRERLEDLTAIADNLFQRHGDRLSAAAGDPGATTVHLSRLTAVQARFRVWLESAEARERPWSGNVRELQSLIRSWMLGFDDRAKAAAPARGAAGSPPPAALPGRVAGGEASLREVEDWYILHVLERVRYHHRQAAEILGIDRGTLARRLRQIDATRDDG